MNDANHPGPGPSFGSRQGVDWEEMGKRFSQLGAGPNPISAGLNRNLSTGVEIWLLDDSRELTNARLRALMKLAAIRSGAGTVWQSWLDLISRGDPGARRVGSGTLSAFAGPVQKTETWEIDDVVKDSITMCTELEGNADAGTPLCTSRWTELVERVAAAEAAGKSVPPAEIARGIVGWLSVGDLVGDWDRLQLEQLGSGARENPKSSLDFAASLFALSQGLIRDLALSPRARQQVERSLCECLAGHTWPLLLKPPRMKFARYLKHLRNRVKDLQTATNATGAPAGTASVTFSSPEGGALARPGVSAASTATGRHREQGSTEIEQVAPKADASLLRGKHSVNFKIAELYLGIGERHRQKLVRSGALVVEGRGHARKITVASLKAYRPEENPN